MAMDLLRSSAKLTPSDALVLSQQAPSIIGARSFWNIPWPLSFLTSTDSPEKWTMYENLFHSCLRTGDNRSAFACLETFKSRFGESNERVMGLIGLYHEAVAQNEDDLDVVLKSYEEAISEKPTNMIIRKRHAALLKSRGRTDGAIAALVDLLNVSPTDAEAWSELAELYFTQGLFQQAIFSLEEVLLVMPFAWNIHARLAETLFISSQASPSNDGERARILSRATKVFSRSIELCDDYLRGHYGLKLATNELKELYNRAPQLASSKSDLDSDVLSLSSIEKLNELATRTLAEIIRRFSTKEVAWQGYEDSEIIAARELLDRDTNRR